MSKISNFTVQSQKVKIGDFEIEIKPLTLEDMDLILDLKNKQTEAEAKKKLIKKILKSNYPDATEKEINTFPLRFCELIINAILKMNIIENEESSKLDDESLIETKEDKKIEDKTMDNKIINFTLNSKNYQITTKEVIGVLEKKGDHLKNNRRSAYLSYKGGYYSIKDVFSEVTSIPNRDFITVSAERILKKLGFNTGRAY